MTTFRVLMVCTANYCRSPIAEQLLVKKVWDQFGDDNTWRVESAGTDAWTIRPIHQLSEQVLTERSAFVPGHQSRQLEVSMLRTADLILTATRGHRSAIARLLPASIGRTFTILQFARLATVIDPVASDDPGELGRKLIDEAKAARALLQPVPPTEDDLADPMGRPLEDFRRCAAIVDQALDTILKPLKLAAQLS